MLAGSRVVSENTCAGETGRTIGRRTVVLGRRRTASNGEGGLSRKPRRALRGSAGARIETDLGTRRGIAGTRPGPHGSDRTSHLSSLGGNLRVAQAGDSNSFAWAGKRGIYFARPVSSRRRNDRMVRPPVAGANSSADTESSSRGNSTRVAGEFSTLPGRVATGRQGTSHRGANRCRNGIGFIGWNGTACRRMGAGGPGVAR